MARIVLWHLGITGALSGLLLVVIAAQTAVRALRAAGRRFTTARPAVAPRAGTVVPRPRSEVTTGSRVLAGRS